MTTKKEVRIYTKFRKFLISNGFIMLQFSVYCKVFNNIDSAKNFKKTLNKNLPLEGQIRTMLITEKQYSDIEVIVGGKSNQEKKMTVEPLVIF